MKSARPASTFHSAVRGATLRCLLLLCIPVASPAQNQPIDPSQQVIDHVHGVVLDSVDRKPIARALVSSQDQRMATMTDPNGRFSFDVRRIIPKPSSIATNSLFTPMGLLGPNQMIYLLVRRPGYLNLNQPVRLSSDPQSATDEIQVKLVPEGMVRGHLSTSNGAEPAGMQVQLRRKQAQDGVALWVQAGGVQANSRGDYRFADLQPGDYKIMTPAWTERRQGAPSTGEASGYAPAYYADTADLASSPPIHVGAGQTVEANLSLRAATFYHVTVPVPNIAKENGINVAVGRQNDMSGLVMSYNSRSQMVEGLLPNGTYDIRISTFGQPQSIGLGRVEVAGRPVKASPITLTPAALVPVIVHHEYTAANSDDPNTGRTGQQTPRRSLSVTLRPVDGEGPFANLKNTGKPGDEDLVVENVQPGAYRVFVTSTHGYVSAISSNGVDLLRQPLVVGPGGAGGAIDITLRDDAATLSGSVFTPNGTQPGPETPFEVFCIPLGGSLAPMPGMIAIAGKFTVNNLAPGEYLVLAQELTPNYALPDIEYQNPDVVRALQTKGTLITLTPGQKAEIQVPLLSNADGEN